MLSVVPQQAVAARNRIVDAWIEDLLAAHEAPATSCSQNQRPPLPKFHPSPATSSNETPFLSYTLRPTNRRDKKKRELHPLQKADLNMYPTPSPPPPTPTPKQGATKKSSRKGRRKE